MDYGAQHFLRVCPGVMDDILCPGDAEDGDSALIGGKPFLDVQGFPRAGLRILGDAHGTAIVLRLGR